MKKYATLSQVRRIAFEIASDYNLDYKEVYRDIIHMSLEEIRQYKSDLQIGDFDARYHDV